MVFVLVEAAVVVTVSEANRVYLNALAPDANIVRVYNGLELDRFPLLPTLPTPQRPTLLSVARFVEKKGLADLLSATARLRSSGMPVRCRLVGTGPLEETLRLQTRDLGLDRLV